MEASRHYEKNRMRLDSLPCAWRRMSGEAEYARAAGVVMRQQPARVFPGKYVGCRINTGINDLRADDNGAGARSKNSRLSRLNIRRRAMFQTLPPVVGQILLSVDDAAAGSVQRHVVAFRPNSFHSCEIGKSIGRVKPVIGGNNLLVFKHDETRIKISGPATETHSASIIHRAAAIGKIGKLSVNNLSGIPWQKLGGPGNRRHRLKQERYL